MCVCVCVCVCACVCKSQTSTAFRGQVHSNGKEFSCNARDPGSIPGMGRSPGVATHSSILAWRIPWTEKPGGLHTVHRVTKSWT